MADNPFDPQDILRILESSLSRDATQQPQLKNPIEGISVFTHACLLSVGFRLVGITDDNTNTLENPIEGSKPRPLPANWNVHGGSYVFRYAHSQSAMQFIVRINRLGEKTAFMALGMGDNRTASFDITTLDYMSESFFPYSLPSSSDIASPGANKLVDGFISENRLKDLAILIKNNIVQKLMPGLMKGDLGEERVRGGDIHQREAQQRDRQHEQPRPEGYDPLRIPRPGEVPYGPGSFGPRPIPEGLRPPGFEDEYEVLQPPRGSVPFPGGRNPLSIGDDDLNPPGLGPNPPLRGRFFGEGGVGGMAPTGGGMHPGPDHPMFGGSGELPNPRAPPGARYDPTFPGDYPPAGGLRGPRGPGDGFGGGPFI
ncbi:hypothetical protein EX30DRAFT_317753 [Ascodesmis nigricans]|uniref:Uncharacterized protein n=1 Tax=Ascodesmis nigricans TaxID=341454 RepID=A0A4S2MZY5_9PEZI|nr:hypothetical protein EX30DRAFT_317753 [Ascodesmis nigricans]